LPPSSAARILFSLFRDRDNTVFHHGYPLNYRQEGGAPSIQVSVAKDTRHADIDVDYRSAKFPMALVNGHLTAANSDVRAGGNTQMHLQRWQGLTYWWRSQFGLPEEDESSQNSTAEGEIPAIPRKGDQTVESAAADYLTSWLVEQKPNLSAAYLSSLSYSCLEEYGPGSEKVVSAGVAPYLAANEMAAVNRAIGKVNTLQDAVEPLSLHDRNPKPVKQRYQTAFSLYQFPTDWPRTSSAIPSALLKTSTSCEQKEARASMGVILLPFFA